MGREYKQKCYGSMATTSIQSLLRAIQCIMDNVVVFSHGKKEILKCFAFRVTAYLCHLYKV